MLDEVILQFLGVLQTTEVCSLFFYTQYSHIYITAEPSLLTFSKSSSVSVGSPQNYLICILFQQQSGFSVIVM